MGTFHSPQPLGAPCCPIHELLNKQSIGSLSLFDGILFLAAHIYIESLLGWGGGIGQS